MPDISGIAGSILGATGGALQQAQSGNFGGAMQKFEDVLSQTLGEDATASMRDALNTAGQVTTLRPEESYRAPRFGGPTQQVAELSEAVTRAVGGRLEKVETSAAEAQGMVKDMLSGGDVELHNVILAAERAQLELQLTMQLRNKLVEAYQEVMRMPI